jgi:hypothetical protein
MDGAHCNPLTVDSACAIFGESSRGLEHSTLEIVIGTYKASLYSSAQTALGFGILLTYPKQYIDIFCQFYMLDVIR